MASRAHAPCLVQHLRTGGGHLGQQGQGSLALAALYVALHDGHPQGEQFGMLGGALGQFLGQGPGGGEGAVRQAIGFQPFQRVLPGQAREQERDITCPEAGGAIHPGGPVVGFVVVDAQGQRTASGLEGQLGQGGQIADLFLWRAQMGGGQGGAEGLGQGIDLAVEAGDQQMVGAAQLGLEAALDLPEQFSGGGAALVALKVGGQPQEGGTIEGAVQGGAPGARRAGHGLVHALGVGLAQGDGSGLVQGGIQDTVGLRMVAMIRLEIRAQEQPAFGPQGLGGGQGLIGLLQPIRFFPGPAANPPGPRDPGERVRRGPCAGPGRPLDRGVARPR